MTPAEIVFRLKQKAQELGFELCGISPAVPPASYPTFLDWLAKGYAGEMHYLERRKGERNDPQSLLPGAKAVVSVALSYNPSPEHYPLLEKHPISCYAWGQDYHEVVREKLEALAGVLAQELVPGAKTKVYADTGPILERSFAAQAGLGWIGKNTLLLNKTYGSFLFLGEILTDADLTFDTPVENLCKTCTACLEACPVGALEEPGLLNATKCISYLTLEHRSPLPEKTELHGYLAGCDLCQTVCPYNQKAPSGREPAFQPRSEVLAFTLKEGAAMDEPGFKDFTHHSALERVKFPMWKRNIEASRPS